MRISDWSSDVSLPISRRSRPTPGMCHCTPSSPKTAGSKGRLHDTKLAQTRRNAGDHRVDRGVGGACRQPVGRGRPLALAGATRVLRRRSEEHTSELQSLMRISYAVFCLQKKPTVLAYNKQHQLIHIT